MLEPKNLLLAGIMSFYFKVLNLLGLPKKFVYITLILLGIGLTCLEMYYSDILNTIVQGTLLAMFSVGGYSISKTSKEDLK